MKRQDKQRTNEQVHRIVNCINDIEKTFKSTGKKTPACGYLFVNKEHDMCAIIYCSYFAKVFFNKFKGCEDSEQVPMHYKDELIFDYHVTQ